MHVEGRVLMRGEDQHVDVTVVQNSSPEWH